MGKRNAGTVFAVLLALLLAACSTGRTALVEPDAGFVHAHTGGVVSVLDPIRIEFVDPIQGSVDDKAFLANALRFDPPLKGNLSWVDDNVLEFRPEGKLPRLTRYVASFDARLLKASWPGARDFSFDFTVSGQALDISFAPLQSARDPAAGLDLSGTILTRDAEDGKALESVLSVSAEGRRPAISWVHDAAGRSHSFIISGLERGKNKRVIEVSWDGKRVAASDSGRRQVAIPATGEFAVLDIASVQDDQSYIDVVFSDPVDAAQDLRGLISYRDDQGRNLSLKPVVDRNRVRVYTAGKWPRQGTLTVDPGIRSGTSQRLVAGQSKLVSFPSQKPAVRFAGNGVIVPTTQGLTIPVETMNLKYVMVEATRVYHANIPQFLQVNNLAGTRELYRVGRVVWRQVVDLGWKPDNQDKWMRSGLDLTKLLQANPDGLFRIRLTFRMNHVVWSGDTGSGDPAKVDWPAQQIPDSDDEDSYWDYSEEYQSFDYSQRNNPANPSYYHEWSDHKIDASRSVMISDIGLLASRDTGGAITVAANDLRTTQPLANLALTVLDYTMHPLTEVQTDAQGLARVPPLAERPYFIVGKLGGQYGYLKLGDSDARSVSSFDVAGEANEGGFKGFLYGERGVWRPGDTIYLNFILQDPRRTLPADHPVTLELYNPQGQLFGSWTRTASTGGFYHFPVATSVSSPTGAWNARIRVGGRTFERNLKVETVMPNRLKIDFNLLDSPNGVTDGLIQARLGAMWLTGVKSPGLKAQVQVSLSPASTVFPDRPDLKGFIFDDPARVFSADKQTVFEGTLDNNGQAEFDSEVNVESFAPGKLRANFDTRVYEPGGAFSVDAFSVDYHPYSRYVGIKAPAGDVARGMLLTDVDHPLQIVVVGPDGKPVSGKTRVRAELFKMEWRWWWEGGEDAETMAEYISNRSLRPIKSETLEVVNGKGQWKFRVAYPDWGRFMLRVTDLDGNHSTGQIKYIDWPGWAGRNQKDGPGGAAILQLTTDQPKYQTGDTVSVSIPGNQAGRALVSIEKNGSIIREEWLQPSGATTVWKFTATPEMAPNVYVHVTFLQPHLQTQNDVPIRTYGIVPVMVENPASRLSPRIASDDTFKPGTTVKVKVSEAEGRPMTYTLALVDEGLLSLTRYQTPNPWDVFYKREASLLRTWDLYDFVAGAFTGTLENLLSIGGSDEGDGAGARKANRFPPLVRFLPPANLAAGETREVSIDLPEYVGAVRLMVVAANQPSGAGSFAAYGVAEKSVTVKKEVMVLATLPRVLSPGEEADVPVSVLYIGDKKLVVPVSLTPGGQLSMVSAASQNVSFDTSGEKIVTFRVKAKDAVGIGSVRVMGKGASDSAVQDIELDIRQPTNPITVELMPGGGEGGTALSAGQSWSLDKQPLPGFAGSNSVRLELSTMPPIDLGRRLDFLIQYPHGCIEQTTSAVFPQLFLAGLMDLSAERQSEIQNNVQEGILRLRDFQLPNGGFSYWPGQGDQVSAWGTSYAGHFLLEAKRAGYAVPADMLSDWSSWQRDAANNWNDRSPAGKIDQAYRLYTLALDGSVDLAALNRLKEVALPDQATWRLAAAYLLVGQAPVARDLVKKASTTVKKYREHSATFGSDIRDKAMILESLALLELNSQALTVARELSADLAKDQWLSTQESAYALLALSRMSGLLAGNGQIRVSYSLKDSTGASVQKTLTSTKPILISPVALASGAGEIQLTVKNEGSTPVFPRLLLTGTPAAGNEKDQKQGLSLKVRYYDANGTEFASLDNLTPGADVYAEILVQNLNLTQNFEQLALTHLVPSGFEIINDRMTAAGQDSADSGEGEAANPMAKLLPAWFKRSAKLDSKFDWQDVRDDRIYTYFSLPKLGQKLFRVHLVAAYKGRYYLPSIKAEAMYDGSINALAAGYWVGIGEKTQTSTGGGGRNLK